MAVRKSCFDMTHNNSLASPLSRHSRCVMLGFACAVGAVVPGWLRAQPSVPILSGTPVVTTRSVTLSWNASTPGANGLGGYNLYRDGNRLNGTPIPECSYTDAVPSNDLTYTYALTAVDSLGAESAATLTTVYVAPVTVSGMRIWLRADKGVTVSGDRATSWRDQSGRSMDATQTNSSLRPTFVLPGLNGKPVLRFNGTSNAMNLPHFMTGATAGDMFVVVRAAAASLSSDSRLFSAINGHAPTCYPVANNRISDGFATPSGIPFGAAGVDLTVAKIYNVTGDASGWSARLDGTKLEHRGSNQVAFTNTTWTPVLGADRSGSWYALANWFGGDVAEIIIYDRALTIAERQEVGEYLAQKYALPIAAPANPGAVAAVALSPTKVAVSWVGDDTTVSYTIERSAEDGVWQMVAALDGQTSVTDSGLAPGTAYSYRVKATNYGGSSGFTQSSGVTTFPSVDPVGEVPTIGLRLWLRPEDIIMSRGGVSYWADRSGLGNHAAQTAAGNRPQLVSGGLHGQPVARFNGTASSLALPNFTSGMTAGELFVVLRATSASPGSDAALLSSFGNSKGTYYPKVNGQISDGFGSTTARMFSAGTVNLADGNLYNVAASNSGWNVRINGADVYSATTNTVNFATTSFVPLIGADRSGAYYALANWFSGDVAEMMVYDHTLASSDRLAVSRYVYQKFGIGVWPFTLVAQYPAGDLDGDGLSNADEVLDFGTDPAVADTDGDGMPDGWEVRFGLNPRFNDSAGDPDGDGMSNVQEYNSGRNPSKGIVPDDGTHVELKLLTPLSQ